MSERAGQAVHGAAAVAAGDQDVGHELDVAFGQRVDDLDQGRVDVADNFALGLEGFGLGQTDRAKLGAFGCSRRRSPGAIASYTNPASNCRKPL